MERGAWWATIHRVAKSQTLLKRLSVHTCAHTHTHTHTAIPRDIPERIPSRQQAGKGPSYNHREMNSANTL